MPASRLPARLARAAAAASLAAGLGAAALPARAVGALFDVQVVDRDTGATLPAYWHQGRWYVPGKPGARYAVSLTNRTGGRALAVLSVDGVNVVSGETAATDQAGYVLAHGQNARITGWRKDLQRVAAFEFTALPNSYAARTGRPDNVGVIGVAVFRERHVPPPPPVFAPSAPPVVSQRERSSNDTAGSASSRAPSAPGADSAQRTDRATREESRALDELAQAPMPAEKLGTGHGRTERSATSYTSFERAQPGPNEVIAIHYDSRDNLIALGVIPVPRSQPQPFPATTGFVPDPPRS